MDRPSQLPHTPDSSALRWPATAYALAVGAGGLSVLAFTLLRHEGNMPWLGILLFAALSLLVQRSSYHLGTPATHSLSGLVDVSAAMALGSPGALAAALAGLAYLELVAFRHRRVTFLDLVELPLFDAGLKALLALLSAQVFAGVAGWPGAFQRPLPAAAQITGWALAAAALTSLVWFGLDHFGWAILDLLRGGWERLHQLAREAWPQALLTELLPLPLSLLVAEVYLRQPWAFALLALAVIIVALAAQRWADRRQQLTQRVAELSAVELVARAIAQAQLDVDTLCQLLYEHASRIADTTIFHVGLFDGDDYAIQLWMREGVRQPERTFHLSPGVGLVTWMRETRQPLLIRDFDRELGSLPARPAYVSDRPPRSALFVPLIAGDTVVGTLSIQSYLRHAYGESDLRVLSAMGSQAALAIQKARLYDRERRRARELETIGLVSRKVSATLKLEELFRQTVHLIRDSFGYYHVALFTADRHRQTIAFQASASAGHTNVAHRVDWGQGLIGWVAENGQTARVNDVNRDERYLCIQALDETRSELTVPLLLEDELVGILDVESDQVNAFDDDDQFILETLGAQVAIAIQEAHLYEAEQQKAWLSTALLQVADALRRLSGLDEMLTTIVRLTPMLSGVDRCGVLLWESDEAAFVASRSYGLSPELRGEFERLSFPAGSVPALDQLSAEQEPVVIGPDEQDTLLPAGLAATFHIGALALLPLVAQGELLGVLLVDFAGRDRSFSDRVITMLAGIANQAAMGIQSARLLQAQREEAYVSMALLQVADAVGHSAELTDALGAVVRITPLLVGVEACAIFLWDAAAGAFLPSQQYGLPRETLPDFWQARLPAEGPPAAQLRAGRSYLALEEEPSLSPLRSVLGQGSVLFLPVSVRGELVGILSVDCSGRVASFLERRLGILTGIAGQVAVAVENDRLLREAAEQERMKQELEVARRIQTSFLPESCPSVPGWEIAAIWRSAREVAGDFYDFVPIDADGGAPGQTGVVIADVADKGVPAALFMALSRTLVRTMAISRQSPAAVIAQANNLILADARADLFVTLFYAVLRPGSGEVVHANAGHPPPLLARAHGGPIEELRSSGMAMGVLPNQEYAEHTVQMDPGDALILYTDGVVEATNVDSRLFGPDRLRQVVRSHAALPAGQIARAIDDAVAAFAGDAPQSDDLTLVIVKREGASEP